MAGARGAARRRLVARSLRRRNRARRTWAVPRLPWRVLWVLLPVGALGVAGPPILRTLHSHPYFAVSEVVIHHRGRLPEADLHATLGIARGDSIWDVDPAAVEGRLRARPWVRSASVHRELPDRVVVRLREYRPAAIVIVPEAQPSFFYVAANGRIFAPVGTTDGRDLPYITGLVPTGRTRGRAAAVHRAPACCGWSGASPVASVPSRRCTHRDPVSTLLPGAPPFPLSWWGTCHGSSIGSRACCPVGGTDVRRARDQLHLRRRRDRPAAGAAPATTPGAVT
jgi:hypothetical protein